MKPGKAVAPADLWTVRLISNPLGDRSQRLDSLFPLIRQGKLGLLPHPLVGVSEQFCQFVD